MLMFGDWRTSPSVVSSGCTALSQVSDRPSFSRLDGTVPLVRSSPMGDRHRVASLLGFMRSAAVDVGADVGVGRQVADRFFGVGPGGDSRVMPQFCVWFLEAPPTVVPRGCLP